ncbi:MAG: hypothetical protein EZS28_020377, partial [Streblomastix strix]
METGFRLGQDGVLGGGIYFALTKDDTDVLALHKGVILKCRVDIGRSKVLDRFDQTITKEQLEKEGYDSTILPKKLLPVDGIS